MNINLWRKSLIFWKNDMNWMKKLAITELVSCVPLLNFSVLGFIANIYRNVILGKIDQDVQPEWNNAGDFILKGAISACILLAYGAIAVLLCTLSGIIFGIEVFGSILSKSVAEISIFPKVIVFVITYVFSVLAWTGYMLYAETMVFSRAFRIIEVLLRIKALGKDIIFGVFAWIVTIFIASKITGFLPLGNCLLLMCICFCSMVLIYGLAKITAERVKPVLGDVIDVSAMEYAENVHNSMNDDVDEYGYAKVGGKKASHYADHRPDISLTWSTDSDRPE